MYRWFLALGTLQFARGEIVERLMSSSIPAGVLCAQADASALSVNGLSLFVYYFLNYCLYSVPIY